MPLSDQAQALLDMVYRVGAPRFHELSVAQARHSFEKLQFVFGGEPEAVASTLDVPLSRTDGSALIARLYRPLDAAPTEVLPLLIYFHGGGWCVGSVQSHDALCRRMVNRTGCAVLSVDYRLAPEHPFPAAVEDALFATEWALTHAQEFAFDPARLGLGGDSAGGNLALVTALRLRDRGAPALRCLCLIYPCTEIESSRPSREAYASGYFLDRESLSWFFERYLPDGDTSDWRVSPMRAHSLADLPPTIVVTAECDPLRDDGIAFVERARSEGVPAEHVDVAGMVHGFVTLGKWFPEANEVVDLISRKLRGHLAKVTVPE
ncbi:alpha/beta hydrolase [Aromatoleum petrolei]|uniref:Alpha/beta hydrolase fold domain-containing protein n=1 Tax=Aromatoleum petrolei TaxID=76116 RepID=A0ABX1MWK7_9RHOO|nr:alpha/beta hydrolase [Aromatoleum petrolei]NMF91660.1 alpha/beta hydrolase fold domain-containing protein [Aromatoleum petrolei]QTQ35383.1 Alpha/Beta hydrolase fold domain-containing protein [Aromatoleum petrolei]